MPKLAIVVLLLCSCGPKTASPPDQTGSGSSQGSATSEATGDEGAVCSCSDRRPDCTAVECRPDLICGYGCGIPGCDSTCMTREEFERSMWIP